MAVTKKLIFYLIPLICLVLLSMFYWGPSGTFGKAKSAVSTVKDYAPDVQVGLDELQAEEKGIPVFAQKEFSFLKQTLEDMIKSNEVNCFASFGGFTNLDEGASKDRVEGSRSYEISYDSEKQRTRIQFNSVKAVQAEVFFIEKMKPCVIAGTTEVTKNFFDYYINKESRKEGKPEGKYYYPVNKITFSYDGNNIIRVVDNSFPLDAVDESDNYNSLGLLFKGENNEICFFPTNQNENYDQDGIDKDYISYRENDNYKNSLIKQLDKGDLKRCNDDKGVVAIELYANGDSSNDDLLCEGLNNDVDEQDRWIVNGKNKYTKSVRSLFGNLADPQTQETDCNNFLTSKTGKNTPKVGCWITISEDDDNYISDGGKVLEGGGDNDCAVAVASPGEILPGKESSEGSRINVISNYYNDFDSNCIIKNLRWTNNYGGELLCDGKDHYWKSCSKSTLKKEIEMDVNGQNVKFICSYENNNYVWKKNKKVLSWIKFSGLELFGDEDDEKLDKIENDEIFSACDYRGKMGITAIKSDINSLFPCPSEKNNCNNYFSKNNEISSKGCKIYLSEDDDGNPNECGYAIIKKETIIDNNPQKINPESIVSKETENEKLDTFYLLANHNFYDKYGESYICSEDSLWYLCENRKKDSVLRINNNDWVCKQRTSSTGYIYVWEK